MASKKAKRSTRRTGQGSVYERKDGRWGWGITYGYDENQNPKRYQGVKRTRADAVAELNRAMVRMNLGVPVVEDKQTLSEFLRYWLAEAVRGKKAPKTLRFYEQIVRTHIDPRLGRLALGKVNPQHIQALLNEKEIEPRMIKTTNEAGDVVIVEGPPLSAATVGHIRATLRAALNTAWKWGLIRENPASKVSVPRIEREDAIYLTPEEAKVLVAKAASHYLGPLIVVAINTGLRLGEATGLTWSNVDLDEGVATISHQLQRVDSKLILRNLKTKASRRKLPLTPDALEALKRQRARQAGYKQFGEEGFNALDLCFTTLAGQPLDPKTVDENLKALATSAELEKKISFHKLRHTAGTHLVANGVPLNVVKEILGHSQIAITANLYAHAVPAAHKAAFDALERAYNGDD